MKSSRDQFEEWIGSSTTSDLHRGIMLSRHENGNYNHLVTNHKWEAWHASRAAIEIEFPSKEDPANFFCEVYSCDMVHESLANCGIKVKS